jgi:toxin ParE1/3/4
VAALLVARSRELAQPLRAGRRLPEYRDDELREVLERPFRIIYRVTPKQVEIVTVKHYRQQLPSNPKHLTRPQKQ